MQFEGNMWFNLRLTYLYAHRRSWELRRVCSSLKAIYWKISRENVLRMIIMFITLTCANGALRRMMGI